MRSARIDAGSGLRGVVALAALALAGGIAGTIEPDVRALQSRVDDARLTLRSDEVAFGGAARLRGERSRLAIRFASAFAIDPQAQILRRLAAALRRHGVLFSSTQNGAVTPEPSAAGVHPEFEDVHLTLELHGSYRGVLLVVDELARDCELARVESASLHRAGNALNAHLSVALLRPARGG
jgi:hypothetical protein